MNGEQIFDEPDPIRSVLILPNSNRLNAREPTGLTTVLSSHSDLTCSIHEIVSIGDPAMRFGSNISSTYIGLSLAALMIGLALTSQSAALAAELIEGRCRMDSCSWFSVEKKDIVGTSSKGTLFKVTSRWWYSEHPGGNYKRRTRRTGGERDVEYIMCSKTSPAVMSEHDGKWEVLLLGLGDKSTLSGAGWSAHIMYFAVCHNIDANKEGLGRLTETAGRRFGYRVAPESLQRDITIQRPEDMLE